MAGGGEGGKASLFSVELLTLLLLYSCLNLVFTFYNSWAVRPEGGTFPIPTTKYKVPNGGFPAAVFYSVFHCIMSTLGSYIVLKIKKVREPSWAEFWDYKYGILPCALLFSLNVGLNNASLRTVSVFVNGLVKSLGPIPTMIAEFFYQKIVPTWQLIGSVGLIVLGLALCIEFKAGSTTFMGVLFVIIATTATSIRPVFASELMSGRTKPKLHPALVLFYEQCTAVWFMVLLTIVFFEELKDAIKFMGEEPGKAAAIIIIGATTAFTYNLTTFYFTRAASALTVVITGNALKVVSIILAAFQARRARAPTRDARAVRTIGRRRPPPASLTPSLAHAGERLLRQVAPLCRPRRLHPRAARVRLLPAPGQEGQGGGGGGGTQGGRREGGERQADGGLAAQRAARRGRGRRQQVRHQLIRARALRRAVP